MKRRSESEASLPRHLKRANSSVFSISTIVEQDTASNVVDGEPAEPMTPQPPPPPLQPPTASAARYSCSEALDGGFYVEDGGDDNDNDNNDDERADANVLDTSSCLPVLSPSRKTKKKRTRDDDNVTGVIFESSDGHCDRNNRLHKERPQRIVSIKDHLARPESHHI